MKGTRTIEELWQIRQGSRLRRPYQHSGAQDSYSQGHLDRRRAAPAAAPRIEPRPNEARRNLAGPPHAAESRKKSIGCGGMTP
jgi:hypothetical protein